MTASLAGSNGLIDLATEINGIANAVIYDERYALCQVNHIDFL
ncbi:MAG: hypothetical protein OXC80_10000 [Gammaproteobacteria bacterium]|nr:hypothetical protein [Gammaproteobacteria bacterium]